MRKLIFGIVGALALVGCGSSQKGEPAAPAERAVAPAGEAASSTGGGMQGQGMAGMCPMKVDGTTARAQTVEGGVAIVFTTDGDVAELRRRVAHMAEMHNRHHGEGHSTSMEMQGSGAAGHGGHAHGKLRAGDGQQGDMMKGGMMKGGMMKISPATARSEEVEGGARIVLVPRDPVDLAELRDRIRQMSTRMASGECPMMSMQAQAADPAPSAPDHETHH